MYITCMHISQIKSGVQRITFGSLVSPSISGSWGLTSGYQGWQQAALLTWLSYVLVLFSCGPGEGAASGVSDGIALTGAVIYWNRLFIGLCLLLWGQSGHLQHDKTQSHSCLGA